MVDHLPLVRIVALQFARRLSPSIPLTWQDLYAEGCLALCECWRRFEAERGARFWTFALPRVRGAMLDLMRQWSSWHRWDHAAVCPEAAPPPAERLVYEWERERWWDEVAGRLPEREAAAILALYRDGMGWSQAARRLGISQAQLGILRARGVSLLRSAQPGIDR